jgi:N,N'-diacetyllegionaminate synthase
MMNNIGLNDVQIGKKYGSTQPCYLIAEIGSNHGGNLEMARKLVRLCAEAGANAVKFQSWTADKLQNILDIEADGRLVDSQAFPVLKKYELPEKWHPILSNLCHDLGIDFISTPFDVERARLIHSLGVPAIKIASGDITYTELLAEVGRYDLPILLSTGMANLGEIERALECLEQSDNRDIVLLHCVGAYPPKPEDANLRAIVTLSQAFGLPVGISDHFPGHNMALAAVTLGACVVEKHVTLSRDAGTPDAPFALEIDEFRAMVKAIRQLEQALGDGRKRCMPSEAGGLKGGRRCLFAARELEPGHILNRQDIAVVRPNVGPLQPYHLESVIGRKINKPVQKGAPLCWEHMENV